MSEPNRVTAERLVSVFSSFELERSDALPSMAALYHPDVEFKDPIQTVRGRDAFLQMSRKLIERSRRIRFITHDASESGDRIFLTWTMLFVPKLGPELTFEGVSHCTLRQGVIAYQRDYWDLASSFFGAVPVVGGLYGRLVATLA